MRLKKFCMIAVLAALILGGCQKSAGRGYDASEAGASRSGETESGAQEGSSAAFPAFQDKASMSTETWPAEPLQEAAFDGSIVSIVKSDKEQAAEITAEEIRDMVRSAAPDLKDIIRNGQTVVIKPNLVQMRVDSTGELLDQEVNGVTTDWRVTDAVVRLVREYNPDGKVYIMEGSAAGPTSQVMEYFHYTPEYIRGVDDFISLEEDCGAWQDFEAPEVVRADLPDGLLHKTYYFNKILYEADVLISIPCLKTSSGVVVTAGIKNVSLGTPPGNLYGAAPDNPSKVHMVSHKIVDGELDRWIYDYYCAKPINYVIVDGLQGFQYGPTPMSGERKETDKMNMGVILGGKDAVAVDTICALIVGWDPESVGYLNLFRENKGLGELGKIRVKGAFVDDLRKHFTIKRPELGGVQITDEEGPSLEAWLSKAGEREFTLTCAAGGDACKLEAYLDGYFQYAGPATEEDAIKLDTAGLAEGRHEVQVIAYDRFLNKTSETLDFTIE